MARAQQTIVVSKRAASTREEAARIARRYADRIYTVRETGSSFRFRQRPPTDFKRGTFKSEKRRKGVSIVWGELK